MNHTVVHFEIPADSMERAVGFYQNLFGWKFEKVGDGEMEYWLIMTVPVDQEGMPKEPGVNGGMMKRIVPEQTPVNYISVEAIDEYAKKVEEKPGENINICSVSLKLAIPNNSEIQLSYGSSQWNRLRLNSSQS